VFKDLAEAFRLEARLNVPLEEVAVDGDRPKTLFFLGASEASCSIVETRWGGFGSGVPGLEDFRSNLINPYLSTSLPLTSSQSSIPPASSCSFFIRLSLLVDNALWGLGIVPFAVGLKSPCALFQVNIGATQKPWKTHVFGSPPAITSSMFVRFEYLPCCQSKFDPCSYIDRTF
jgi:hypothetical protein